MLKNFLTEENKNIIFFLLFISLVIVCMPRFDRADYGPIKKFVGNEELYEGLPYDILIYKNYIEYFRTGEERGKIHPPYSYRLLIPFLASLLPFAPLTSLNLVNFLFVLAGIFFLYKILEELNIDFNLRVAGCLMYIFSFPVFYYATSGYIDGSFIGLEMAAVFSVVKKQWAFFFFITILSSLASEKTIILLPFLITFLIVHKVKLRSSILIIMFFLTLYLITTIVLRKFTISSVTGYVWMPAENFLMQNIFRPKIYISFLLTFGVPGILAVISYFKLPTEKVKLFSYFYAGCLTSILLYLFSIFSAWADGRTVWTAYPFAIPLSVIYLQQKNNKIINS